MVDLLRCFIVIIISPFRIQCLIGCENVKLATKGLDLQVCVFTLYVSLKFCFKFILFDIFLQEGIAPEEVIKFGSENIVLDSWVLRRQYTALKDALGTGVTLHLQVKYF